MSDAGQERRDELASLYALGVIDPADYTALREELAATPALAADLRALVQTTVGLSQAVPLVDPPAALRARVLTSITGKSFGPAVIAFEGSGAPPASPARITSATTAATPAAAPAPVVSPAPVVRIDRSGTPAWAGWLAAAAALIIAIGTGAYALQLRDRVAQAERRATNAERDIVDMRRVLDSSQEQTRTLRMQAAVLIAPDMARVDLAGQQPAPGAAARAFWSRSRGMVFAATSLPQLPAGKVYQLWVVASGVNPISAGLLTPDAQGQVNAHFVTPPDIPVPVALAVTLEPEGGVPQPTGEKFLIGATGL
jgi:anti-sigma-K factor RskA